MNKTTRIYPSQQNPASPTTASPPQLTTSIISLSGPLREALPESPNEPRCFVLLGETGSPCRGRSVLGVAFLVVEIGELLGGVA